jgi:hypothetical protein
MPLAPDSDGWEAQTLGGDSPADYNSNIRLLASKRRANSNGVIAMTNSLDETHLVPDIDTEGRVRANTAPVDMSPRACVAAAQGQVQEAVITKIPSEDDEEIKRAMAMAIAHQKYPHLNPDEIRQMLAKEHIIEAGASSSGPPFIPGRLLTFPSISSLSKDLEQNIASWTDATLKASSSSESHKGSFRDRARGRFSELLTGGVTKHANSYAHEESTLARDISMIDSTPSPKEVGSMRLPFRSTHPPKSARTPPISPIPTDSPEIIRSDSAIGGQLLMPMHTAAGDGSGMSSTQMLPARARIQKSSAPIRISGIAWKRRGGMGKFSSTAAWERRRIELQGTRLLYYQLDLEDDQDNVHHPRAASPAGDFGEEHDGEGVVVTKRANWLEQAASQWALGSDDPTMARGYIDLAKEKATVHTAYGHSGAPSPFSISVKVRGETKWKLCFDYHKTLMEWFVALTDVVVQNAVDNYNRLLLQSVDPANQSEHVLFQPPSVSQPPPFTEADAAHRLWLTEPYAVSSSQTPTSGSESAVSGNGAREDIDGGKLVEAFTPITPRGESSSSVQVAVDDEVSQQAITDSATKTWTIPESNVLYVVGVLNVALVYARSSSISMEGFWYLLTVANLGIYLCLAHEPDWRSVLSRARVVFGSTSTKATSSPALLKPSVSNAVDQGMADSREKRVVAKPKLNEYVPMAGCSTVRIENSTDQPLNAKGEYFAGWRYLGGDTLMVRSHGYLATKAKVASPGELYKLVNVDIFESRHTFPDMAPRVKLPSVNFDDSGSPKSWRSPDTFIVSIALPTDPPSLGRQTSDGGGYTITMYFQMKQETRDILKRVTGNGYDVSKERKDDPQSSQVNAVRLFEEWCRRAPTDQKFQTRFKVVPNAHNLKEIGMPGWIAKYNGKPFLIKRPGQTGFLFNHPELSCMEFDVSLHPFPYLAKQAICFMKDKFFKSLLVTFGFVIEGRADDEVRRNPVFPSLFGLYRFSF